MQLTNLPYHSRGHDPACRARGFPRARNTARPRLFQIKLFENPIKNALHTASKLIPTPNPGPAFCFSSWGKGHLGNERFSSREEHACGAQRNVEPGLFGG